MTSVIVPPVDLAPGMPSRVVTISATDVTEGGTSMAGQMVRFALSDSLDVTSGGDVIAKTQAEVVLDSQGNGSIRLPVYTDAVKTWCGDPDWAILVTATWGSQKAVRVPAGTTSIALSALPPVRPLRGREKQWAITGVSLTVTTGTEAGQASGTATLNGGVIGLDLVVPPAGPHTHPVTDVDGLDEAVISTSTEVVRWGTDLDAIPQRTTATDAVFAWADNEGRVAAEVDQSGAFLFQRDLSTPAQHPVAPQSGWRHAVTDEAGHVAHGVDEQGRFQVFRGTGARTALRTRVACIGDSLTYGFSNGANWPREDAWPSLIQADRPDIEVLNLGYGGRTTDEIRLLVGALPLYLSPTGGTIPASGPVAVETAQVIGWSPANVISLPGTLAGVGGVFERTSAGMTFTRAGTGPAVAVATPARLHVDVEDYSSHTVTLWVGRNDVSHRVTGMYDSTADCVVAGVLETVEWLAPRSKSVVVLSVTNQVAEREGTEGYGIVTEINARLQQLMPHRFVDIRTYLVHQAIHDAGVTPTTEDLAQMAADAPPLSIWDGGSHFLPSIAPLVAARIQGRLTAKGFI